MLSILFGRAERLKWRPKGSNPCAGETFELPELKPRARRANWEEYDAVMQAAEVLGFHAYRIAIAMAALTGQRSTQIRTARIEDFQRVSVGTDGTKQTMWVWHVHRTKRDTDGVIPIHAELAPLLAQAIADAAPDQTALLVDEVTGAPYSKDLFKKRWARVRAQAAKEMPSLIDQGDARDTLQFRDLRRTNASWARRGGASRDDAAAVLGNSAATDWGLGETYMPPDFWTALRAIKAIQRPDDNDQVWRAAPN